MHDCTIVCVNFSCVSVRMCEMDKERGRERRRKKRVFFFPFFPPQEAVKQCI
jgi:hypothetical protein